MKLRKSTWLTQLRSYDSSKTKCTQCIQYLWFRQQRTDDEPEQSVKNSPAQTYFRFDVIFLVPTGCLPGFVLVLPDILTSVVIGLATVPLGKILCAFVVHPCKTNKTTPKLLILNEIHVPQRAMRFVCKSWTVKLSRYWGTKSWSPWNIHMFDSKRS